jgi:hypothetical protein
MAAWRSETDRKTPRLSLRFVGVAKKPFCGGCEEALDGVAPASGCRREMERPSRMAVEPSAHIGVLMGGTIVDDGVDRLSPRRLVSR